MQIFSDRRKCLSVKDLGPGGHARHGDVTLVMTGGYVCLEGRGILTQLALGRKSNPNTLRIEEAQVRIIARHNGTTTKRIRDSIKHGSNITPVSQDRFTLGIV
jgi:hypothetical protein